MSNTLAQSPAVQTYSSASSVSRAFGSAGSNPSLYVAAFTMESVVATVTITDDKNAGNYAQDATSGGSDVSGGAGYGNSFVCSKQNTSTGTATVTATLSLASYGTLQLYELTGAATSSVLDAGVGAHSTSFSTPVSLSLTTGAANTTIIACKTSYSNIATVDTGFTASFADTGVASSYHKAEYVVDAGATSTRTMNFGDSGSKADWSIAAASYKTASGGGGVFNPYFYRRIGGLGGMSGASA